MIDVGGLLPEGSEGIYNVSWDGRPAEEEDEPGAPRPVRGGTDATLSRGEALILPSIRGGARSLRGGALKGTL